MHRTRMISILAALLLSGCSLVNFSANYYTLPDNYRYELSQTWKKVNEQLPIKKRYTISIIDGRDSNRLNGVPAISGNHVLLPMDFVKYVYQNYYDDRFTIFSSVMVHEISHEEFDLPSSPPLEHLKSDIRAIGLLGGGPEVARDFYRSLYVMKNYWFARKGMAGHALNTGWNAVNLVSVAVGGPGFFKDWYATDLEQRMKLIARHFDFKDRSSFPRSSGP